jgi:hypothetical protein
MQVSGKVNKQSSLFAFEESELILPYFDWQFQQGVFALFCNFEHRTNIVDYGDGLMFYVDQDGVFE